MQFLPILCAQGVGRIVEVQYGLENNPGIDVIKTALNVKVLVLTVVCRTLVT